MFKTKAEKAEQKLWEAERQNANRRMNEIAEDLFRAADTMEKHAFRIWSIDLALIVAPNGIEANALEVKQDLAKHSLLCAMGAYDSARQRYNAELAHNEVARHIGYCEKKDDSNEILISLAHSWKTNYGVSVR